MIELFLTFSEPFTALYRTRIQAEDIFLQPQVKISQQFNDPWY